MFLEVKAVRFAGGGTVLPVMIHGMCPRSVAVVGAAAVTVLTGMPARAVAADNCGQYQDFPKEWKSYRNW